jgi:hypothetical protein
MLHRTPVKSSNTAIRAIGVVGAKNSPSDSFLFFLQLANATIIESNRIVVKLCFINRSCHAEIPLIKLTEFQMK